MLEKFYERPEDLLPKIEQLRTAGSKLVFGNGCFDVLHVGHVRYLEAARALGDLLVIAVNTDESIAMNVGREQPINPFAERVEMIAALAVVDYVIPLTTVTPIPLIELFKPAVQAKGTDYSLDQMPERDAVERNGGTIAFVGDEKTHSSTALRAELRQRSMDRNSPDHGENHA